MNALKKFMLLLLVVIVASSCTSLVRIRSNASDAEVYIDDQFVGNIENNQIVLELDNKQITSIRLKNPKYESFSGTLLSELKIGNILLSPFTSFISLFWLFGPVEDQTIELNPLPEAPVVQVQEQEQQQQQQQQQTIIIQVAPDKADDEN